MLSSGLKELAGLQKWTTHSLQMSGIPSTQGECTNGRDGPVAHVHLPTPAHTCIHMHRHLCSSKMLADGTTECLQPTLPGQPHLISLSHLDFSHLSTQNLSGSLKAHNISRYDSSCLSMIPSEKKLSERSTHRAMRREGVWVLLWKGVHVYLCVLEDEKWEILRCLYLWVFKVWYAKMPIWKSWWPPFTSAW